MEIKLPNCHAGKIFSHAFDDSANRSGLVFITGWKTLVSSASRLKASVHTSYCKYAVTFLKFLRVVPILPLIIATISFLLKETSLSGFQQEISPRDPLKCMTVVWSIPTLEKSMKNLSSFLTRVLPSVPFTSLRS